LLAAPTLAFAILTPHIPESQLIKGLPDPLEAYLRPLRGLTTFTLFPWAGFFTAGCVVGICLHQNDAGSANDSRLNLWLTAMGAAVAVGGYLSAYLPPLFPHAAFWTSSPTFFFVRVGVLLMSVAVAFALSRAWRGQMLQEFGRASLFVYWVHVELVYGIASAPLHRRLPLAVAAAAFLAFTAAMFGLVRLKAAIRQRGRSTKPVATRTLQAR
jgi:uncharacterized membrane protein